MMAGVQLVAMAATGKQMPTYHRLLAKLNAAIMQFINGMPVMKAYRLDAKGYREYADAVTEYNEFWKQCTKSQGYSYGVFVAIVESGIRRMVDQLEEKPPLAWLAFKADTRLGSGKPTTGKLIYAVRDVVLRQKVPSTRL